MEKISNSSKSKSEKQKLTLGIDREVIDRAKAAGINISQTTEQLLKSMTYEPEEGEGNDDEDVAKAYEALFNSAFAILHKYRVTVEVGFLKEENCRLVIWPAMFGLSVLDLLPLDGDEKKRECPEVREMVDYFYEPKTILQNIILAVANVAKKNKEKIKQLELASRFVKVLSDDDGAAAAAAAAAEKCFYLECEKNNEKYLATIK
jgi:hypothetical protein